MNEKITLPALIQLLAIQTGDTRKQSEDFIKEFFNTISSALADGEQVKIKSLGVFKTISVGSRKSVNVSTGEEHQIPAHRKVVFVPCKEIAALVNEPFEMFDTVELNDNVDLEEITDEEISDVDDIIEHNESVSDGNEDAEVVDHPDNEQKEMIEDGQDIPAQDIPVDEAQESERLTSEIPQKEDDETDPTEESDSRVQDESSDSTSFIEVGSKSVDDVEQSVTEGHMVIASDVRKSEESQDADVVYVIDNEAEYDEESDAESDYTVGRNSTVNDNDDEDYDDSVSDDGKSRKFGIGFLTGFISAVVVCGLVFLAVYYVDWENLEIKDRSKTAVEAENIVEPVVDPAADLGNTDNVTSPDQMDEKKAVDKVDENSLQVSEVEDEKTAAPTQPSDQKVYDVISKTRYLTTMAKDHYGNFNLWPYIYIENQAFLGHPDRIKPGTKVVIPPLSKYGVDPSNPADIAKAKKKGVEIYSRYK